MLHSLSVHHGFCVQSNFGGDKLKVISAAAGFESLAAFARGSAIVPLALGGIFPILRAYFIYVNYAFEPHPLIDAGVCASGQC